MVSISLQVNGKTHGIDVDPATPLLLVLRNNLGLTGAKLGCGLEQCGACAVLVDGQSTLSCSTAVSDFQDKAIATVEGLTSGNQLSRVQQAFVDDLEDFVGIGNAGRAAGTSVPRLRVTTVLPSHAATPILEQRGVEHRDEPHEGGEDGQDHQLRALREQQHLVWRHLPFNLTLGLSKQSDRFFHCASHFKGKKISRVMHENKGKNRV